MSGGLLSPFEFAVLFLGLVCGAGLLNRRFLGLPPGAAMLLAGLLAGLAANGLEAVRPDLFSFHALEVGFSFREALLGYMLAFLLFAGAMSVDYRAFRSVALEVALLATLGVAISTLMVGLCLFGTASLIGAPLSFGAAMVFAALISPTDPVAVLATVKRGLLPPRTKALIQGEALFNDGVGILVFRTVLALVFAGAGGPAAAHAAAQPFAALLGGLGGLALGAVIGLGLAKLLRRLDDAPLALAATLAAAGASYALAERFHLSGALSSAAAGLMAGARGLPHAPRAVRQALEAFWTLADELLNALLFLMIGLEALLLPLSADLVVLTLAAFALTLGVRLFLVAPVAARLKAKSRRDDGGEGAGRPFSSVALLTLGGLRGGLSLALALSLPIAGEGGRLIALTWGVVALSVLVQGLAFGPASRLLSGEA